MVTPGTIRPALSTRSEVLLDALLAFESLPRTRVVIFLPERRSLQRIEIYAFNNGGALSIPAYPEPSIKLGPEKIPTHCEPLDR